MKKTIIFLILFYLLFSSFTTVKASDTNVSAVIFLEEEHDEEYVYIYANVIENNGLFSLSLTLDYDHDNFQYIECQFFDNINHLDPIITKNPETTDSIIINLLTSNGENDFTTGYFFKIKFRIINKMADKEFVFSFKNEDLIAIESGTLVNKYVVIRDIKVDLKTNLNLNENTFSKELLITILIFIILLLTGISCFIIFIILKKYKKRNVNL